jgi:2,3-dimethylmalate lyase
MTSHCRELRNLITDGKTHVLPGAYDALTAKLACVAGFEAVYMSGYGASAGLLGLPDIGLATMTEVVTTCANICAAVDRPVVADADTGYGGPTNVRRTVQEFERAGAAAVQLEDQEFPKRCGHMAGKRLIETRDMVAKIEVALEARSDPDFVIIARTDAIALDGVEAAIERAAAYGEAGADMVFVDAPETMDEITRIANELDFPLVFDWSYGGVTPSVSRAVLEQLGYNLVVFPDVVSAVHRSVEQVYSRLRNTDSLDDLASDLLTPFDTLNEFLGLSRWVALDRTRSA